MSTYLIIRLIAQQVHDGDSVQGLARQDQLNYDRNGQQLHTC